MATTRSLLGRQPLQRGCILAAGIIDDNLARLAKGDGDRGSKRLVGLARFPFERIALRIRNGPDIEIAAVERDDFGIFGYIDIERRRAFDPARFKVDVEVERNVIDARFQWLGKAMDIDRIFAIENRRNTFWQRAFWRFGVIIAAPGYCQRHHGDCCHPRLHHSPCLLVRPCGACA